MRSSLRRQLLHLATDLSALAANPDDLGHGFDLLTRSYPTPVADAARAALRSDGDDTWLHQRVRHTPTSGMWCAAARPQRPEKQR